MYNTTVYAVVSDNASHSPMLKMGRLVKHIIWHSTCNSHTGNLLAKDVTDKILNENISLILKEYKHPDLEKLVINRVSRFENFIPFVFRFFADLAGVEGPWVPLMLEDAPSLLEHLESNLKSNEFSKLSLADHRDRFVCVFFVPDPSSSRSLVVVVNPFYLAFSFGFPCRLFFVFFSFGPS
jgi:hypothetical protein